MKHCDQAQEPLLIVSGVTLGYPGIIALTNITFTVNQGEFIGIAGPNGSGKSTLLKGILSLLPVQSGVIRYCGYEDRSTRLIRKHIGYVPQKNKTDVHFPALVREVVLMGLYAQIGWVRRPKKSITKWCWIVYKVSAWLIIANTPSANYPADNSNG